MSFLNQLISPISEYHHHKDRIIEVIFSLVPIELKDEPLCIYTYSIIIGAYPVPLASYYTHLITSSPAVYYAKYTLYVLYYNFHTL